MTMAREPNNRLRMQRLLRGWTQDDVAAGLHRLAAGAASQEPGVDATMVSRWERGSRRPRPRYVHLLCQLFELPAEQLGLVEEAEAVLLPQVPAERPVDDEVERREFIRRVTSLLGLASVAPGFQPLGAEPWERLASALQAPSSLDDESLEHLQRVPRALANFESTTVSAGVLMGPVTGHLDAITLLLKAPHPGRRRAWLCTIAAETAAVAGRLRRSMDDENGAEAYFRTALEAAHEAGDRVLGAYLVGVAASRPPYREDPEERLRRLAEPAFGFSASQGTPSTQVWLAAKEADAWAMLDRADECFRTLDRAEAILERALDDLERQPVLPAADRTWLAGERGACLAKLGRPRDSQVILHPVLASLGPTRERDWLWLTMSLATTYVQEREPEEACRLGAAALSRAARKQLVPIFELGRGLREELRPFGDSPAVTDFDEQLRSLGQR